MAEAPRPIVNGAVEGVVDEAILRRLIREAGAEPGAVFGKNGKQHLLLRAGGYNQAAQVEPWLLLIDLDRDAQCPPAVCSLWLENPARFMCFCIAVREVEAWLLADRTHLARFLHVSVSRLPQSAESLDDPKQALVNLARGSRRRDVREDMVPRPGSRRAVGPAYASRLIEFIDHLWVPQAAARQCSSLRRAMRRLETLVACSQGGAGRG